MAKLDPRTDGKASPLVGMVLLTRCWQPARL